jgi:signal transduction histidine kinase
MQRWVEAHGRLVVGAALGLWGLGLLTFLALTVGYGLDFFGPIGGPWVLAFGTFAVTGAIITWHRPGQVIGLLFLVLGLSAPVPNSILALAMGPFAEHSFALRTLFIATSVALTTMVFPLLALTIALFPDGRLPSVRWRWYPWTVAVAMALGAAAAFSAGGWGGDTEQVLLGPPLDGRLSGLAEVLSPLFFLLIVVLMGGSTWAAVLRYRRSESVARQQMKWLALAVLVVAFIMVGLIITQGAVSTPAGTHTVVMASGIALIPVSAGIAILRHRLYDVDVVLNRAIVFGLLAAFITGLYAAVVVGVGSLIGDRSNVVLTIGTTALVAVVFEPVRARVQHLANRAVYGHRATPYEVLSGIVDELGTGSSSDDQLEAMALLLADGTGAEHATIWVQVDEALRAVACSPSHDPDEHEHVDAGEAWPGTVAGATHTEPVVLDGELLGALSFDRGREDPMSPPERALMTEMAGQASLLLGNARLRARLEARVEELRASRQRLVAAQDEARRKLERDLHDGAQQQLVALKVKLGLARTLAGKEGAGEQVTELIEGLSAAADEAVESLRTLARGIYPPLLEAEGLERALATQAQRAPIPVDLRAEGLRRYERQIEATVYFCVLEAVRNSITHADATCLQVRLDDRDGQLRFRVVDDGCGFDPAAVAHGLGLTNMGDRIDALGGSLTIEADVEGGAQVVGSVPVPEPRRSERPEELAASDDRAPTGAPDIFQPRSVARR